MTTNQKELARQINARLTERERKLVRQLRGGVALGKGSAYLACKELSLHGLCSVTRDRGSNPPTYTAKLTRLGQELSALLDGPIAR